MENNTKIIDLNQRRKFNKYKKWFELYAKFLSLFKKGPKVDHCKRKAKVKKIK